MRDSRQSRCRRVGERWAWLGAPALTLTIAPPLRSDHHTKTCLPTLAVICLAGSCFLAFHHSLLLPAPAVPSVAFPPSLPLISLQLDTNEGSPSRSAQCRRLPAKQIVHRYHLEFLLCGCTRLTQWLHPGSRPAHCI